MRVGACKIFSRKDLKMKNKSFFSGVLVTLLFVLVFNAGRAYAAGCFTDYNTAAACWLKDNGIVTPYADGSYRPNEFLKRSDAANYLFRANKVPPRVGDFHFSQSLSSIGPNGNFPDGRVEYYSDAVLLRSTSTGTQYYQAYATVPTSIYGRAVVLKGVQVCYNATFGGASLTRVDMTQYYVDATTGSVMSGATIFDPIARTDKTCREYHLSTPAKLSGDNHIALSFAANFTSTTSTTGKVGIYSITVILSPSSDASALDIMNIPFDALDIDPSTLSDQGN